MNFAWPAAVILVLLLPGFFFFFGLYSRERFDRSGDVSGRLAAIVSVAVGSHFALLIAIHILRRWISLPTPDVVLLLSSLNPNATGAAPLNEIGSNAYRFRIWIAGYLGVTSFLGWLVGICVSKIVIGGHLRSLMRSAWLYDLWPQGNKSDSVTHAFVFSKIPNPSGPGCILYRGTLRRLGLADDGRISYLVLGWPSRCVVTKDTATGATSSVEWRALGKASSDLRVPVDADDVPDPHGILDRSFYVHVDETSNLVFENYPKPQGRASKLLEELNEYLRDRAQKGAIGTPTGSE